MTVYFNNKKARFDFEVLDEFEAGIELLGWEVKSIRAKTGNINGSWAKIRDGEIFLENLSLSPWKFSQGMEQIERRSRKLLLHKQEIIRLESKTNEQNVTVVPLKIFTHRGKIKCLLALGKGRKKHDKKQVLKERTQKREAQKMMKQF